MTLATQYDWIVLGDHPAALLSANLVSKLGLSVLILPRCSSMKVSRSDDHQVLDPETNFLLGIEENGLLRLCLEKAGISFQDLLLPDSLPQALTPHHRIQFGDSSTLARELDREKPKEARFLDSVMRSSSKMSDYWKAFPRQLTLEIVGEKAKAPKRTRWEDVLKNVSSSARVLLSAADVQKSNVLESLRFGLSGQTSQGGSSAETEILHTLMVGASGAGIRGGLRVYRELLLRSAKNQGATVLEDGELRRIFVENGRFCGVQLASSGNMVGGTGCILGSSFDEFSERVSMNGRNWFSLKRQWPDPSGWKFSLAFTVGEEAIPPGTSRRMVWKEAEAPAVEIEIVKASEYGDRDPSKRLVFLRTVLPYHVESLSSESQRMVAARMFRLACELMPYLEYHVIKIYPDFRPVDPDPKSKTDLKSIYPFRKLEDIPDNLKCYGSRSMVANLLGGSGSGIEGLFVSSSQSSPELGSLGPVMAALEAVAWIAHRMGLQGPL